MPGGTPDKIRNTTQAGQPRLNGKLSSASLPTLEVRASTCAVPLLIRIGEIDVHRMYEYQSLLDENDRHDLCRGLIAEGRLGEAVTVAESIVWPDYRVDVLAEVVRAATEIGQAELAARATKRAQEILADVRPDELPLALVRLGGAQARTGNAASAQTFSDARRRVGSSDHREGVLLALAGEQDELGLLDAAEVTIGLMDGTPQRLEALEHHAVALGRAGTFAEAAGFLRQIGDGDVFVYRRRAVMTVAAMMAGRGDRTEAVALIDALLDPAERSMPLAHVVPLVAAADLDGAVALATRIKNPFWHASALVELASVAAVQDDVVREAIDAEPDRGSQAILFAQYAISRGAPQRERLLGEAVRRARAVDGEDRWRTLAEVAAIVAGAGLPAAGLFGEAREALLAGTDDAWEDRRDLWELARIQYQHGDPAGARQTYAAGLAGDDRDTELRLAVLGLIGVAIEQARHAGLEGAVDAMEGTARVAIRGARHIDPDERSGLANQVLETYVPDPEVIETPPDLVYCFVDRRDAATTRSAGAGSSSAPVDAAPVYSAASVRSRWAASVCAAWCAELGLMDNAAAIMERVIRLDADQIGQSIEYLEREGNPTALVKGCCRLARASAELGDLARAAEIHRRAIDVAEAMPGHSDAAHLLIGAARSARRSGQLGLARETLAKALRRIPSVDWDETRHYLLSLVAKEQAAGGDVAATLATANGINHEALQGEAMLWAAAHARPAADIERSTNLIRSIKNWYCQAIGLVLVSAGLRAAGEATVAIDADAQRLIDAVPDGEAKTRVLDVLVEANLATGDHPQALGWFAQMLTDRPAHLMRLAYELLDRGDHEALRSLVSVSANQLETAFLMCAVLAGMYPESADEIAAELGRFVPEGQPTSDEDDEWEGARDDEHEELADEYLADLTGGVPLSYTVEMALQHATAVRRATPVNSADLLRSLEAMDTVGDWSRIILSLHDAPDGDPHDGPPVLWSSAAFTQMCAQAFRSAALFSLQRDLLPVTPGALAIGLITDPRSAAAQALGITTSNDQQRMMRLIHEDLLGCDMS